MSVTQVSEVGNSTKPNQTYVPSQFHYWSAEQQKHINAQTLWYCGMYLKIILSKASAPRSCSFCCSYMYALLLIYCSSSSVIKNESSVSIKPINYGYELSYTAATDNFHRAWTRVKTD